MTTIVYRNGILAADSRAYAGSKTPVGTKRKIRRLEDGSLFGCSSSRVGQPENIARMVQEHGVGKTFEKDVPAQVIVIQPDGAIYLFNDGDSFSGPIQSEFLAIGSGEEFATGALLNGASAAQAVEIAIRCDPWSDGPILTLMLNQSGKE